jgi:hypothetical protein
MPELYIDESNYTYWTGAGNQSVDFDGSTRILNFVPPQVPYGEVKRYDDNGNLVFAARPIEDVVPLIPRDEWNDRIKEKDANNAWLRYTNDACSVQVKDQDGLGYCHAYGTVSVEEILIAIASGVYVNLSAESIGGIVTKWHNQGADPMDDLAVAIKNGACEASFMDKPNSLSPSRWKQGWQQNALNYRMAEYYDLRVPGKTFDAVMTCYLLNFPIGLGYAWWSHFVHGGFRARWNATKRCFDIELRNSWGRNYGDNGYFWLPEGTGRGQGTPDWAFAGRAMLAV